MQESDAISQVNYAILQSSRIIVIVGRFSFALADSRGRPPGVQILSFSCSFRQTKLKNNSTFVSCFPLGKILDPPVISLICSLLHKWLTSHFSAFTCIYPGRLQYPSTHSPITLFPEPNSNTVTMQVQASINEFPENIIVFVN